MQTSAEHENQLAEVRLDDCRGLEWSFWLALEVNEIARAHAKRLRGPRTLYLGLCFRHALISGATMALSRKRTPTPKPHHQRRQQPLLLAQAFEHSEGRVIFVRFNHLAIKRK